MAQPSTLYKFLINLSDVEKGVYKSLEFPMAMHPSESHAYLLTRLLAFVLNDQEYLAFSQSGLSDPDEAAIYAKSPQGDILLWIEIGSPSARKLHKATKAARQVKVYTYKSPFNLLKEIQDNKVYHAESIEIFSFDSKILEELATKLERRNSWDILINEGTINISVGNFSVATELTKHPVMN